MVSMTIRNVPEATRDRLAARADRAGQSLQEYMRAMLIEAAERPTRDDWLDEARARLRGAGTSFSSDDIVGLIHEGRGERR